MEILVGFIWFHTWRALSSYWLVIGVVCEETPRIIRLLICCLTEKSGGVDVIRLATWGNLSWQSALVDLYEVISIASCYFRILNFEYICCIFAIWRIMLILSTKTNFKWIKVILLLLVNRSLSLLKHFLLFVSWLLLLGWSTNRLLKRCSFARFVL